MNIREWFGSNEEFMLLSVEEQIEFIDEHLNIKNVCKVHSVTNTQIQLEMKDGSLVWKDLK